jgi:hypothetical protein
MALSETLDDITGGDVLRLPALQSPNYVAGTAGWIIKSDGTVEFNSGIFRGSVEIGTDPGKHIIVANAATGDAVDVYNAGNQLIFFIDNTGRAVSIVPASGNQAIMSGGFFTLSAQDANPFTYNSQLILNIDAVQHSAVTLLNSFDSNSGDEYILELRSAGISGVSGLPMALGTERNIRGSLVQSDQIGVNNMVHPHEYVVTTNASGVFTITHNCSFTPTGGVISNSLSSGIATPIFLDLFDDKYTSTTCQGKAWNSAGAALAGSTIAVTLILFG